jgi:hypothetical protein
MAVPHRSRRLTRLVALGATAAALAAPPAVARPIDTPNVSADTATPVAPEQPVVVHKIDDGFDWGSAAIGAGGAGALAVVVALGGVAYSGRRRMGVAR